MSSDRPTGNKSRKRRLWLLLAGGVVIASGLALHFLGAGAFASWMGDALYAALVYFVLAVLFPRASPFAVGAAAVSVCVAIELFQLTGFPAMWAESFWPTRLVLGAGFDALDLVAYFVGACVVTTVDVATLWRPTFRRNHPAG